MLHDNEGLAYHDSSVSFTVLFIPCFNVLILCLSHKTEKKYKVMKSNRQAATLIISDVGAEDAAASPSKFS